MLKKGLENNYEDSDRCKHSKRHIRIMLCSMRWRLQSNRVKRGEKR